MNKQGQIDELKTALEKAEATVEDLRRKVLESEARDLLRKESEDWGKVRSRADAEREALDLLNLGYVKVDTLRHLISEDYEVTGLLSEAVTRFTLRLVASNRVGAALRDALLRKPKPGRATGGYVSGGGVIELSPHDRDLLARMNAELPSFTRRSRA